VGPRNSSRLASVLRSGGCNAFAKTGLANRLLAEGVLRPWRSIRGRFSHPSARNGILRSMRLFRRFTGGESQEVVARCPGFFARHGPSRPARSADWKALPSVSSCSRQINTRSSSGGVKQAILIPKAVLKAVWEAEAPFREVLGIKGERKRLRAKRPAK
jgi:hypothetical protein